MPIEFIDPGAFRTELVLEAVTPVSDGLGGYTETWSEVATVLARIEPLKAASVFGAGQALESVTHSITMRYRDDVAAGMRLRRNDRVLAIVTAHDPDETGRYLACLAREEQP